MASVRIVVPVIALLVAGCTSAAPSPSPSGARATSSPSASATPLASAGGGASAAATPLQVVLGGKVPIGLDIVGNRAWVILTDSGRATT